jgi:hypothetical protein
MGEALRHPTLRPNRFRPSQIGAEALVHFLMKRLPKVATEMALHVLAYNLTRVMNIIGVQRLLAAMRACLGSRQGPAFA